MHNIKTPTVLGVAAITIAIFAFVLQVKLQKNFNSFASPSPSVQNITVSSITDQSASISWTTEKSTFGLIKWGEEYNSLTNSASSSNNAKSTVHKAKLTSLKPLTVYFVAIYTDGKESSDSQNLWKFTTKEAQVDYVPETTILFPAFSEESS